MFGSTPNLVAVEFPDLAKCSGLVESTSCNNNDVCPKLAYVTLVTWGAATSSTNDKHHKQQVDDQELKGDQVIDDSYIMRFVCQLELFLNLPPRLY